MRPSSPPNLMIRATAGDDGMAVVEVEALSADGGLADFLQGQARILSPKGESLPAALQQIGPGRYRTEFALEEQGAYLVNVLFPGADGNAAASIQAAVSVPYQREFSTVRDNRALLESIAARTGGVVFSADTDFEIVDPFDRGGLEMPSSPTRIWDLLVVIAAGLFVLDVAVRRLTFDTRAAREAAAKAMTRRDADTESTVAAWKTARRRAGRKNSNSDGDTASTRFDVEDGGETDFSATADAAGADDGTRPRGGSRPVKREVSSSDAIESEKEAEDMTSRLLRAKRRATGGQGGEENGRSDG